MSTISKYEMICNDLIKKIEKGVYKENEVLPSETQMIEIYNVSRITIRRAIDELAILGYIEKNQGKRCTIKNRQNIQELNRIFSYTEEILKHGMTPTRKIIECGIRLANTEDKESFHMDRTAIVFSLKRVIYANNFPLCYSEASLPYYMFQGIDLVDFTDQSLYDIIENSYQIKILTSALNLKALPAEATISEILGTDENQPILYTHGITYGNYKGNSTPIEYFKSYYNTEYFEYSLIQKR